MNEMIADRPSGTLEEKGRSWLNWCWPISLFLVGLAAKLYLIVNFVIPVPIEDQWDGEAMDVYVPYFQNHLTLRGMLSAHNEHRIFFTRIYDLALLLLNDQWDNELQTVVNAILHCAILTGFGCLMARSLGKKIWPILWLPLAVLMAVPFAWENTLEGFQSQFYFLLLGSLLAIRLLGLCEPMSLRWWLGAAAAFATLFTMAAGSLTAIAIIILAGFEICKQPRDWQRHSATIILCATIAVLGVMITPEVPMHEVLRAHSIGEFLLALGKNLSWPCPYFPWLAPFNLIAPAMLAWFCFRSREKTSDAERMVLGMVIWVVLQAMAITYSRGVGGKSPASRYQDLCSLILVANCLCMFLLWSRHREQFRFPQPAQSAAMLWALFCVVSLGYTTYITTTEGFAAFAWARATRIENARGYVLTGDEHFLMGKPVFEIPYGHPDELMEHLRTPELRRILPACARDPLAVTPKEIGNFRQNGWPAGVWDAPGEKGWSSVPATNQNANGTFESQSIKAGTLPFLEIAVAGDLGMPGLSLELVELASGKVTEIKPSQMAGTRWVNVDVKTPREDFKIVARNTSSTAWFAFKEPRELGRLSYWAAGLAASWMWVLGGGLGCLLMAVMSRFKI